MPDLATELANLNAKATELLAKYNGAFEKLDEETQNKIIELQDKAAELQAQIESLGFKFDENGILVKEDGSEISVGNALKLGGKSLDKLIEPLNIYKTFQLGANSGINVDLGLQAGEYRFVFGAIYLSADGDLDDHFNCQIGKGDWNKVTWGNKGYPQEAPADNTAPVTHMGEDQGGGNLKIGNYGYWTQFLAVLNDDGTLTIGVTGNDTSPYIAIKIAGGIR